MTEGLRDGVWLNLPEAPYFKEDRLGSTDLCRLFLAKEGWWWKSKLNPDYVDEPEDAKARTFGKALHALILEGQDAFEARFAIAPSKDEEKAKHGDLFCVTVGEIETALEKRSFNPKRMTKDALIEYAKSRAPDLKIWDVIEADWKKTNPHRLALTGPEYRQVQVMVDAVHKHAEMGPLFQKGADNLPLVEVSILWTDEHGLRRRARLDDLLPATTLDVKALSAIGQKALSFAVPEHVAKFAYFCQMADHHVARTWAYRMIREGLVFDGTPEAERTEATEERHRNEVAWLSRFPTEATNWEYCWLFYARPDAKKGVAPIVFPWVEDYGSELHMDGIRARRQAIQTYRRCMLEFGPDVPWTRVEPVHTTEEGAAHRVFLPSWIAQEAMPGEDEDL